FRFLIVAPLVGIRSSASGNSHVNGAVSIPTSFIRNRAGNFKCRWLSDASGKVEFSTGGVLDSHFIFTSRQTFDTGCCSTRGPKVRVGFTALLNVDPERPAAVSITINILHAKGCLQFRRWRILGRRSRAGILELVIVDTLTRFIRDNGIATSLFGNTVSTVVLTYGKGNPEFFQPRVAKVGNVVNLETCQIRFPVIAVLDLPAFRVRDMVYLAARYRDSIMGKRIGDVAIVRYFQRVADTSIILDLRLNYPGGKVVLVARFFVFFLLAPARGHSDP